MSLCLRRISLDSFRKFRTPLTIEGLSNGLNIIIECNETGKSTLLEALRAAFFVRHNTKNQLAQSYAPHGEAVAPGVQVSFEVDGAPWSVAKRFLRSASVEVNGPQGRAQGEEAEARLNTLLGSVRDTSRGGDVSTYGALGLLWVAQTEALEVTAPGALVRETVTSTLEAEVGSIMGGPAYKRVRDRIDDQFSSYWTPTGQKRGRQTEARERAEAAEIATRHASERLVALEKTFSELEGVRARLKVLERDLADATDAQTRKELVSSLEVARAAAQILATRRAEYEAASGKVRELEDLQLRHEQATDAYVKAKLALKGVCERRGAVAATLAAARQRVIDARAGLDSARASAKDARVALSAGQALLQGLRRSAAIDAARERHKELLILELQVREAKSVSDTLISTKQISALEEHERHVAEARAILNAGATRLAFSGSPDGIFVDGEPVVAGERTITRPTTICFGDAELLVTPPAATESAEQALATALDKQSVALEELGVKSLAGARLRNEAAREAAANLRTLHVQIQAVTPADPVIELAGGGEALKLRVSGLAHDEGGGNGQGGTPDVALLGKACEEAEDALARAGGAQDSAIDALRRAEEEDGPLAAAEARATSDLANATGQIEALRSRPEFAMLAENFDEARKRAAQASVKLEEAVRDATAHDPNAISKKIDMIDARNRTALEARTKLVTEIARLENTVEIEGGAGLAERAAAAREEAEAASAALQRVTIEADTLKLLRDTLDEARAETSAKFVGPIAKRAKRHIERLLPGCELSFSEDLALVSVTRNGVPENCAQLSRGTQEQLAVLTRVAFADMLREQGRPVSLILDDPLVYSDDARLDHMIDVLTEAAERMQVILLTCRDRAFRHVPANRVSLLEAT